MYYKGGRTSKGDVLVRGMALGEWQVKDQLLLSDAIWDKT